MHKCTHTKTDTYTLMHRLPQRVQEFAENDKDITHVRTQYMRVYDHIHVCTNNAEKYLHSEFTNLLEYAREVTCVRSRYVRI